MMSKCHCGRPFAIFAFLGKLMHIWTIGVFSCLYICICKTRTFPSNCFPPLRPSSASVRWHRCITTGRETWRQELARRKKRAKLGKDGKKVSACGGQILRVASSWARKGAKLSTLRLFLFPVVVNCTRCVITVIAARQREELAPANVLTFSQLSNGNKSSFEIRSRHIIKERFLWTDILDLKLAFNEEINPFL